MRYAITTDTAADMPWETMLNLDGAVRHRIDWDDAEDTAIAFNDTHTFFERMREGGLPSATAPQPKQIAVFWEPYLIAGKDMLFLCASRHLSATFSAACKARPQLLERYPDRRIVIVDTENIGIGQAALVHEAAQMRQRGKELDEVAQWIVKNRVHIHHMLIPMSTQWLSAGGFLEGAKGKGLLRRIPLLELRDEFVVIDRYADMRKAFHAITEYIRANVGTLKGQIIVVGHADHAEQAQALCAVLRSHTDCAGCSVVPIGLVTGAYAGPDALSVMFFGAKQQKQADQ